MRIELKSLDRVVIKTKIGRKQERTSQSGE